VVCQQCCFGEVADRFAGVETEGEETAHDAGEDGDGESLAEVVVGFSGFGFFFGRDFALFRHAGGSVDGDADDADENAEQDDLARGLVEDGKELAVIDRRDDGSECSTETESDGVSESDAEVAYGEAEGEASGTPEDAPEDRIVDAGRVLTIGGVEDSEGVGDEDPGEDDGCDDPCGEALDEPIDLPRPALDAAEGDEIGGGGESSDPVKDDTKKRIRSHEASF